LKKKNFSASGKIEKNSKINKKFLKDEKRFLAKKNGSYF
jgi:hypothetical protein